MAANTKARWIIALVMGVSLGSLQAQASLEEMQAQAKQLRERAEELKQESKELNKQADQVESKISVLVAMPKIEEVVGNLKAVEPKKPRKLLIFSRTTAFRHSSIEVGAAALLAMGEKTGAYSADHTEDPDVFTVENLAKYDGIVMLNTTGRPIPDGAPREAMLGFLAQGKGLIGIHAATDCHGDWPEYLNAMGGMFDGHPWNANSLVTLYNEEPEHPVVKNVPQGHQIEDEIYQYKDTPYFSRERLRILLSLDLAGENMKRRGMKRKDHDYAVSWVRDHDGARVFYSNLGHNESTYHEAVAMQHFLDGIQWAVGDIEADARPSAEVGRPKPKPLPEGF